MQSCSQLWQFPASASINDTHAQSYPTKPIRIITANSAGGTSDIFSRALGEELQKRLGQPIVIENRSGGGMNIAGRACAEAANDGYTICILPNEVLTLNQFTFKSIPYNPEKDFDADHQLLHQHPGDGGERGARRQNAQ